MSDETEPRTPTPDEKRKYLASLRPDPDLAAAFRTPPEATPEASDS